MAMESELFAVRAQAIATIVLVVVTIYYVRLTWRLTRHAEQQIEAQRKERERIAKVALYYELLDIVRSCPEGDRLPQPVRIATPIWDTMKADLGILDVGVVSDLTAMYGQIRRANAAYDQYLQRREQPPGTQQIPSEEKKWAQLLSGVVDTVRRVSTILHSDTSPTDPD